MRALSFLLVAISLVAGCVSYPSRVDDEFGLAVSSVRAQQVIDPDAPSRRKAPPRTDGQASKSAIDRYQKSFDVPPPPVSVLNSGDSGGAGLAR